MIKNKNIIKLIILLTITVLITLLFANIYKNYQKEESKVFTNIKEIRPDDFNQYMVENTDVIILVADKTDLSNDDVIEQFINDIKLNELEDKLIFINKNLIKDSFVSKLKSSYNIDLDINKIPAIVVINDRVVDKISYINKNNYMDLKQNIDYQKLK